MAFDMMDGISMLKDPTTGKICLHENYRDGIIDQCTMICLFSIFIAKGIKNFTSKICLMMECVNISLV